MLQTTLQEVVGLTHQHDVGSLKVMLWIIIYYHVKDTSKHECPRKLYLQMKFIKGLCITKKDYTFINKGSVH